MIYKEFFNVNFILIKVYLNFTLFKMKIPLLHPHQNNAPSIKLKLRWCSAL